VRDRDSRQAFSFPGSLCVCLVSLTLARVRCIHENREIASLRFRAPRRRLEYHLVWRAVVRRREKGSERETVTEGERSALAVREGSSYTTFPTVTFVPRPIRIARRRGCPDRCPVDLGFSPVAVRSCCAFVVSASCDYFHISVISSPR